MVTSSMELRPLSGWILFELIVLLKMARLPLTLKAPSVAHSLLANASMAASHALAHPLVVLPLMISVLGETLSRKGHTPPCFCHLI
mmetsp:Transcript_12334/g.12136  ORF Transcript_12334/g.12136 Transcript_12334/m.12136 type:complete len:86 (-) Transcript_12334:20-277(-)